MSRLLRITALLALAVVALANIGCKSSPTMIENMGGTNVLSQFNEALGANLLANAATSKFLDAGAVDMVKRGITTQVAKMSDMPMPSDGIDLTAVLKEKNMDKAGVQGFKESAEKACQDAALSPDATKSMMSMINGVLKSL